MGDLLKATRGELIKLIYELIDENQAVKAEIAELKSRLHKQSPKDKRTIPAFVKANVKKQRVKMRKGREKGYARVKDIPTERVFHTLEVCPDCNGVLGRPSVGYTRQIIDIPLPQVTVTEHVIFKRWCYGCQKRVAPQVDFSRYVIGTHRMGINVMSLVATLRNQFLQPINKIQEYMKDMHHLRVSEGELVSILHKTAFWGKHTYEDIKKQLLSSEVIHGDETGGRQNGRNGYHWNFSNSQYQFLIYRQSRGSKVVREMLGPDGEDFEGVLVCDFYAAYNEYAGFIQRCWVHYLRDMKELLEQYPKDRKLKTWVKKIKALYEEAKAYTGPPDTLPIGSQAEERVIKEIYFKKKLQGMCESYMLQDVPQSTLCARAMKHMSEMFTFIRFPHVSSDNNAAERAVRHTVLQRKISGGTRSAKGSETKSILNSLLGTWKLQHLNPLYEYRSLLLQAALS